MKSAHTTTLRLRFPPDFHFTSVVYSHGWSGLLPFAVTTEPLTLTRVLRINARTLVQVTFMPGRGPHPRMRIHSISALPAASLSALQTSVSSLLQTGADLTPFYEMVRNDSRFSWAEGIGAGRMLRGETFFEDAVKTILTTNCSWALTVAMNNNLIAHFGRKNRLGYAAFPTANEIAASNPSYLREHCKLGYRSDYVHEFAVRCASGDLDIESFRTSDASATELFEELIAIKGIGEYAAANLMRMLGKFDYLGLDSWCRNKIAELHGNGTKLPDGEIEKIYRSYGPWKGLAMWLDVTRHWYHEKFPLV